VIAPWREWEIRSREDALEYARRHNVPVSASAEKIYSRDRNIWHISHEGGVLEDPACGAPDDVWMLSNSARTAPDQPARVTIGFEKGCPVSLDGQKLGPVALLEKLNELGGRHGIGRIDLVENRFVGMKSRGAYETPGGAILYAAHAELEALCLDRATFAYKQHVALDYGQMVYSGFWFTPLREALDAFIESTQQVVTGEVALELYRGNIQVLSRRSPYSLYSTEIASFTMGESYNQKDAEGFIRLLGLPLRVRAALKAKAGK
jgi:argininosuccinate synthase